MSGFTRDRLIHVSHAPRSSASLSSVVVSVWIPSRGIMVQILMHQGRNLARDFCLNCAPSAIMSALTLLLRWKDDSAGEGLANCRHNAETKNIKSLTLLLPLLLPLRLHLLRLSLLLIFLLLLLLLLHFLSTSRSTVSSSHLMLPSFSSSSHPPLLPHLPSFPWFSPLIRIPATLSLKPC